MTQTILRFLGAEGLAGMYLDGTTDAQAWKIVNVPNFNRFVLPWVAMSDVPVPLPDLSNPTWMECPFSNEQSIAAGESGHNFNTFINDTRIRQDGLWLRVQGALASTPAPGDYNQGVRFYFEEMLLRLDPPFADVSMGYHDDPEPNAIFGIGGPSPHPQLRHWDGAQVVIHDFDGSGLVMPVSDPTQPQYHYVRLMRVHDGGSDGTAVCSVTNSQVDIGVVSPTFQFTNLPANTAQPPQLGAGDAISDDERNWRILWWRAVSDDTDDTASGVTVWSDPKVYVQTISASSGDDPVTWMDAGDTGVYWGIVFGFNQFNTFGASLEGRFAAVDSVPAGDLSGLFAGEWKTITPGETTLLDPPGLQGRYLLSQFRMNPGTGASLDSGYVGFEEINVNQVFGAGFRTEPWPIITPPPPVELQLQGERSSEDTLDIDPVYAAEISYLHSNATHPCEYPYTVTFRLSSKTRRVWTFRWILTAADVLSFEAFWEQRRGGEGPFTFRVPGGGTAVGMFLGSFQKQRLAPNAWQVQAQVQEMGV